MIRPVALRKESVDRNQVMMLISTVRLPSLSARRAWIEIGVAADKVERVQVALRKESVDRNDAVMR